MPAYLFYCDDGCGVYQVEAPIQAGPGEQFCTCGKPLHRNYASENAGFKGLWDMKKEREAGGKSNAAKLFLPTNDDFADEGDPDGKKGVREWREAHQPDDTNKRPHWPGEVEKKVFATGGK